MKRKTTRLSKGNGPPPRGLARGISKMAKALKHKGAGFKTHAMRVTTSSKKHKWRTDPRLIKLIERFGKGQIDLDPCASKEEKYHFAKRNFTLHNGKDGLKEPWTDYGVVYANPEYARSTLRKFVDKAIREFGVADDRDSFGAEREDLDHLFLLVPARPDTQWFKELRKHSTALCFWEGRLKFSAGSIVDPAPFPSLIAYFGSKPKRFHKLFSKHGWVVTGGAS